MELWVPVANISLEKKLASRGDDMSFSFLPGRKFVRECNRLLLGERLETVVVVATLSGLTAKVDDA